MNTRPHNLLSAETKRALRTMYYVRVASVGAALSAVVILLGVVALVPAYVSVRNDLEATKVEVLASSKYASDDENVEQEVGEVHNLLALLAPHATSVQVTTHIDDVLRERPREISITGLSYDDARSTLELEGTAERRADLVAYVATLEKNTHIEHVTLPISDLARNTELSFRITVTFVTVEHKNK